eukprot:TRINITY_DN12414_c0_g1_i2.p2 TRINITY_DN12414_c0_g1~~TRINITY_DN12414_c0_g1_i2.p2  ORF type:complete len:169 (+),score=52.36 TRINITY_DN12414_c0_g1_i2:54-509(+)
MRAAFRALRRCSGAARPRLRADARWTVFCDLDGVLADFERRVIEVTGRAMDDMKPSEAWPQLARHRGFFEHLDWTADGRTLWNHLRAVSDPIVLTVNGRWPPPPPSSLVCREAGGLSRRSERGAGASSVRTCACCAAQAPRSTSTPVPAVC